VPESSSDDEDNEDTDDVEEDFGEDGNDGSRSVMLRMVLTMMNPLQRLTLTLLDEKLENSPLR
jgi:hypothetical protein